MSFSKLHESGDPCMKLQAWVTSRHDAQDSRSSAMLRTAHLPGTQLGGHHGTKAAAAAQLQHILALNQHWVFSQAPAQQWPLYTVLTEHVGTHLHQLMRMAAGMGARNAAHDDSINACLLITKQCESEPAGMRRCYAEHQQQMLFVLAQTLLACHKYWLD